MASILQNHKRLTQRNLVIGLALGAVLGASFHHYVADDERSSYPYMAAGAALGGWLYA